jgi:site-specific recombinase XerD
MVADHQSPLLAGEEQIPTRSNPLTPEASIQAALGAYQKHLEDEGFATNTQKAFASDVRLLGKYLGIGQPVGKIGTRNLNDFMNWLLYERGVPCSRKSYARRVTTLKSFFGWLHQSGVLDTNPAEAVVQISVTSPLPELPSEAELERALAVTEVRRKGSDTEVADARPHLLLTLLLQTGIKKGEASEIVPNHIDRDDPEQPFLFVRYRKPAQRYKERKVALDPEWLEVLDDYLEQYQPSDRLFTCTPRNLEYILDDIAEAAGFDRHLLSFENLRWAAALRDYRGGVEPKAISRKLGLSDSAWRDTKGKLDRLMSRERYRPS